MNNEFFMDSAAAPFFTDSGCTLSVWFFEESSLETGCLFVFCIGCCCDCTVTVTVVGPYIDAKVGFLTRFVWMNSGLNDAYRIF